MNKLSIQIQNLLTKEQRFLHQIYMKTIEDYSYLWDEFEDLDKLRRILLHIIKLFIEEHKYLTDINLLDQKKFKKVFRELISNPNALLQRTRGSQIKEIDGIGIEQWFKKFWTDITTINKIVEKYEKLSPYERFKKMIENIVYEGLTWQKPRTTLDFMVSYVQLGVGTTDPPPYIGLLSRKEKEEFRNNRAMAERAWQQKPTPGDRVLGLMENRWKRYYQAPQADIGGAIFFSKALLDSEIEKKYSAEERTARISFSVNLTRIHDFFRYMMGQLTDEVLAEIPLKFKIYDIMPQDQGNGNNAHLYFLGPNEERVYKAFVEVLYPAFERYDLIVLGGRFLMIPVQDRSGRALKGVEFGQGLQRRRAIPLEEREKIFQSRKNANLATSSVIGIVMDSMYWEPYFRNNFERFKQIFKQNGRNGLVADRDFQEAYIRLSNRLIHIGRNSNYPILDRDAKKNFPNFTRNLLW